MNKQQFIEELKRNLGKLPHCEVEDILRDQEEYIYNAVKAGRSEEEAVASLGDPKAFAVSLSLDSKIQEAGNSPSVKKQLRITWDAVIAVLALAPLNLFFVLGPFLLISTLTFSAWIVVTAVLVATIFVFFAFLTKAFFVSAGLWASLAAIFFAAGGMGLGILGFLAMILITRFLLTAIMAYLKWNIRFIKGRA